MFPPYLSSPSPRIIVHGLIILSINFSSLKFSSTRGTSRECVSITWFIHGWVNKYSIVILWRGSLISRPLTTSKHVVDTSYGGFNPTRSHLIKDIWISEWVVCGYNNISNVRNFYLSVSSTSKNGCSPNNKMYRRIPSDHISSSGPAYFSPASTSGAQYSTVP